MHLLPYRLATRGRQRTIGLWQDAYPFLNGSPIVVERLEATLTCLPRHPDLAKAGRSHQPFEMSSVRQRERQVKHLSLVGKILAECFREHAPHRRALAGGDDAHSGMTARPEHAAKLPQTPCGVGEEHKAELTDHGVEGAVGEWQRLTIRHYGPK